MANKPRVKIVAVAKDEAAYIPEWVHHHLYFGFDAIEIHINRTTDNSVEVIKALSGVHNNVSWKSADWVDLCPDDAKDNLQYIVYAKAYADTLESKSFDYILFLDVDEFWTPQDMRTSIQDCLNANRDADTVSFQWINELGCDQRFSSLRKNTRGKINPLVKTVVKLSSPVNRVRFHLPEMNDGKSVMADGVAFVSNDELKEGLCKDLQHLRPVMIIHRLFRSPMEYISLLGRGRPSGGLQIKLNRGGYNEAVGRDVEYDLNAFSFKKYHESYLSFLNVEHLNEEVDKARDFVIQRYQKTLDYLPSVPRMYFVDVFRVFKGCSEKEYQKLTDALINSGKLERCKDANELIEMAKKNRKIDERVAYRIWELALALRPKGPLVKAKLRKLSLSLGYEA